MNNFELLKFISDNSKYVKINTKEISSFLSSIDNLKYNYWLDDINTYMTEKELIIFSFICESMNYCFWNNRLWKTKYNNKEYVGSETLFYLFLNKAIKDKVFLNVENLKRITKKQFKKIMCSNGQYPDLLNIRYKTFRKTVKFIYEKGDLFFDELFSMKTDTDLLNYIVMNISHFNDHARFKGKYIHFNKRAILLVNDLFRLSKTIRNNIKSVNHLTGGADYAIPRIFRDAGIFVYNKKLSKKIDSKKILKHNSRMEVEIRANTLYVIEILKRQLKEKRKININSVELDNIIWKMRNKYNKKTEVHHTISIFY